MIYGLYLSAQGAKAQTSRLDVLGHNLANASTTAFKRDLAAFQAHRSYDAEQGVTYDRDAVHASGGISLVDIATDFSDGPLLQTGGTLDIALTGPGFLRVSDGAREFLTRNGQLTVNNRGELVTQDGGLAVQGVNGGPIRIPADAREIEIAADGRIVQTGPDGNRGLVGRLALVQPGSLDELEKVGGSLYRVHGDVQPAGDGVQVRQGYLEGSGTQSMAEMLELISASRSFEANVNMIRTQDEALARLLQTAVRR